ncbi:MAG: LemA family protein [Bacteroidetes bacterium]|uniref:LemA family protein n=1 Tax=Candidatus Cryptobacteroides faecipullorum TaxID=2840764 RepID=A0A9D9I579_9BACT|nr:LemA family protein [Candidatus Cryptobacteroides faecipullorum]
MKKGTLITVTVIAVIVLALFFWVKNSYNGLVKADEQVKSAWSQVENVYQRRADLIPNLVATVKGYADHESETLESVVEARSKATRISIDPENLDPDRIAEFQEAQGELSQALGRLIMLQENYPDLKANQNFRDLQAQLEGTENRISTERMKFNETARSYNTMVRSFPKNIIASMFGFDTKGYFEASEGAETAPKVEF